MKPDYLDAVDSAGVHPFTERLVKLSGDEIQMLRQMVTDSFYDERDNTFYDDEVLSDLQICAESARIALGCEFLYPHFGYHVPINWGSPGFNFVGPNYLLLSGTAWTLQSGYAHYMTIFMKDDTRLRRIYAFSCTVVNVVCSVNAYFYLHKENLQTLSANVPITNKKYIVKLGSYLGDTSGYDFVKQAGTTDVDFFSSFTGGPNLSQSNFTSQIVAGLRPFSAGASVTIQIDDIEYLDQYGRNVYI